MMSTTPQNIVDSYIINPIKIKTMGKNQHVTRHSDGGWQVKGAGSEKATKVTDTQKQAIAAAIPIAKHQKSEVVIPHGTNGKIRDKDSYGNDPNPPKDTKH